MSNTAHTSPVVPPPDSHADTFGERFDALEAAIVSHGDARIDAEQRIAKLEKITRKLKKAQAKCEDLLERTLEALDAVSETLDSR